MRVLYMLCDNRFNIRLFSSGGKIGRGFREPALGYRIHPPLFSRSRRSLSARYNSDADEPEYIMIIFSNFQMRANRLWKPTRARTRFFLHKSIHKLRTPYRSSSPPPLLLRGGGREGTFYKKVDYPHPSRH